MSNVATTGSPKRSIKIACIQTQPAIGAVAQNVARSLELIDQAAAAGADLVVLPELANSGYVFETRAEAFALAEAVPHGPTATAWAERAARHGLHLVAGICERAGPVLYNSAVILGPQGHLGTFRKMHLWNEEALFFERGNLGFPVVHTPLGRIGVGICYDAWFPETFRLAALQGADIVCVPTNWVPIPGQADGQPAMATILTMAAAHCNSLIIACADRVGTERGQPFEGQSVIVDHTGWPAAGPASRDREEIIYAVVEPGAARRGRNWNDFNQILRDRRTDVYGEMLGADAKPGWY
ncbi:MAG: nitrilase family protein [Alphaproteobacteria bacterium]|jgi:predicted amidohydrolase|nr:nitrilase family protein [Alphaproteobacteria bacterium]